MAEAAVDTQRGRGARDRADHRQAPSRKALESITTRRLAARRGAWPAFREERSGRKTPDGDAATRRGARHRPAARTRRSHRRGQGDDDDQRRDDEDDAPGKETLSAADVARPRVGDRDRHLDRHLDRHRDGTANDDADDEDGEDDPWFEHLPYILEVLRQPIDAVAILDSIDEDMQLAAAAGRRGVPRGDGRGSMSADRSSAASDPEPPRRRKKAPGEVDEFIGTGRLREHR